MNYQSEHTTGNDITGFKLAFYISFFSILASIVFSFLFKKVIFFYFLSYVAVGIMFLYIFLARFNKEFMLFKPAFLFLLYMLLITIPMTVIVGNLLAYLVFFKNTLLFLPIFMYATYKFKSVTQLFPFLKSLILAGLFFALYICFEFVNKFLDIFPKFNQVVSDYVASSKNDYLADYADPDKFDVTRAIRPLGLEINFTSGGFFMASIFFILFFSGHRFIKSLLLRKLALLVVYLGVIVSTSRQSILFLHVLLVAAVFLIYFRKRLFNADIVRYTKRNILVITALIVVGFMGLLASDAAVYSDFLTGKSGGTAEVLDSDLRRLPENMWFIIQNYPINFLFGIGAYTPTYPGLYFKFPSVSELHFLLDIFYTLGLVGFIVFWSIFVISLRKLWRAFKNERNLPGSKSDLYVAIVFIDLLFMSNNIHYSPIGLSNNFIIVLIPLVAVLVGREKRIAASV